MIIKTDNQYYCDIASAIREKNETNTKYKPSEMAIAIENIESGGIQCTLSISTVPNATVTATLSGTTVSAKANVSGIATLKLPKEGVWTVTATADGNSVSIQVNTAFSITTALTFADPVLANNSWEVISQIAKAGQAKNFWNVGDEKPAIFDIVWYGDLYTVEIPFQIIGFDHDDVANSTSYGRSKAGITLLQKYSGHDSVTWGADSSNWTNSVLREEIAAEFGTIQEVSQFVVPVKKKIAKTAKYGESQTEEITETAFALAADEIFANSTETPKVNEGTQYAYFAAGNSPAKENYFVREYYPGYVIYEDWWTRSIEGSTTSSLAGDDSAYRVAVNDKGAEHTRYADNGTAAQSGVVFAFCL